MPNSRDKGRRAEYSARDELRKLTGLDWERTPSSGALDPKHKLKGDLYVPEHPLKWCVEVKHYKDDQLSTKILTGKDPILLQWWSQTLRQAEQVDKKPLLIFKHDRSKWFAAIRRIEFTSCKDLKRYVIIQNGNESFMITLLTDLCKRMRID